MKKKEAAKGHFYSKFNSMVQASVTVCDIFIYICRLTLYIAEYVYFLLLFFEKRSYSPKT